MAPEATRIVRASIVLPTYNRRQLIVELLGSLHEISIPSEEVEIIVIDDGSTDDTLDHLAGVYPAVRCLRNDCTRGPSAARNQAAALACGDLLLFLDTDGVVHDNWLKSMLKADDGHTVLLGNVVDFSGGRVQQVPRRATFLGKSIACRPERANTGPSCNLAMPRACFEALGGFDEELPYYFEDSDLCIRAGRAGYPFRFVADAIFRHHGTERKQGPAIEMQEHNSTYAMLKFYRGDRLRSMIFTVLNGGWLVTRATWWLLHLRFIDTARLVRGWARAYRRFMGRPT